MQMNDVDITRDEHARKTTRGYQALPPLRAQHEHGNPKGANLVRHGAVFTDDTDGKIKSHSIHCAHCVRDERLNAARPAGAQDVKHAHARHRASRWTRKSPRISASSSLARNVRIASDGVQTIGSPARLNEVFNNMGTPVRLANADNRSCSFSSSARATSCGRALPSTCTIAATSDRFSGRTPTANNMNGTGGTGVKYSAARSSSTMGASGRHASRCLI